MKRIKFIFFIILPYLAMAKKKFLQDDYGFPVKTHRNGTVILYYHKQYTDLPEDTITKAFSLFHKRTCIYFQSVPTSSSLNKTIIRSSDKCSASLELQNRKLLFAINVNSSCINKEILQRLIYLNFNMIVKTKKCILENVFYMRGPIFDFKIYDFIYRCVFFDPHEAELKITNYNLIEFVFLIKPKRKGIQSKNLKQKDYSKIFSFRDLKYINENVCKNTCKNPQLPQCENGGYVNPKNCTECLCPFFYTGKSCDKYEVPKGRNWCGRQLLTVSSISSTKILNLGVECFYRITPSVNKKIVLTFQTNTQINWDCSNYKLLEIKYIKDKTVDGVMPCGNITSFNITGIKNSSVLLYHDRIASMEPIVYIKYMEVGEED